MIPSPVPDLSAKLRNAAMMRVQPRPGWIAYPMPTVEQQERGEEPAPVVATLSWPAQIATWLLPALAVWYWWKPLAKSGPGYVIVILLLVPMLLAMVLTALAVQMVSNDG